MNKVLREKLNLIPLYRKLDEAKNDDLKLVILAKTLLELMINILIIERTKNEKIIKNNEYTYAIKLVILNEKNIINDKVFKFLDAFRKIRNKAAHEPVFKLEDADLRDLPIRKNEKLYDVCITMIGTLWNQNKDIFIQYFNL